MISILVLPLLLLSGADQGPQIGAEPAPALTATTDDDYASLPLQERHGRVTWFEGSYEECLKQARIENRVVLLNFYTDNSRCRKLDREAYCDDRVVKALEPALCLSVDVDTPQGRALSAQYPTEDYYPALVFLDPDGALRDRILGYADTKWMLIEIERVLRDEGTLGDLRRQSEAKPDDLLALWAYARKLEKLDDHAKFEAAVARLRTLDPEAKSLPLRTLHMRGVLKSCTPENRFEPLRAFLAEESYDELLFEGWMRLASFERMCAKDAKMAGEKATAAKHMVAFHRARFAAWPHCREQDAPFLGNNIAWDVYQDWPTIPDDLRREAIRVANKAVEAQPEAVEILDTLACLLFADGQVDEAVRLMQRCVQLDPERELWAERLEMFQKEEA